MSARVSWISITPVKGMRISEVDAVDVTPEGVAGDRCFFLAGPDGAMVNGKRHGSLQQITPTFDLRARRLGLVFPDGSRIEDEVRLGDPEAVSFFGNPETARPVSGDFSAAVSDHVGHRLRLMATPPSRSGVDRGRWGAVSLLGAASLDRLRESALRFSQADDDRSSRAADPGPIDARRFRMTFGVEGTTAYAEDGWVGGLVRIGAVKVKLNGHAGRCAVTTRDPESGRTDLKTLHFLEFSRAEVESHERLPFGVYGEVVEPGPVRLGDPVEPLGS